MRITFNEDATIGRETFEEGNTITTEKHGISDAAVERYWARGWVEVDGWGKAPDRVPGATKLTPSNVRSQQKKEG